MVLIFTNKEDSHPNFVIEHLADAGVPVFRLNTEALLTDYEFSWWADASGCDFVIRCKANGLSVRGSEVTAVWDRRPEKPSELPVQNTALINKHNLDEAFGFLYFIRYYLKDVPSIGSIANDRPASSKMLQLRYALEVGFKVPDTCFTNTKTEVTERLTDGRDYVLKPIESENVWDEASESQWVFFAARTSTQNLREAPDEAYSQTVTFLQEYVDKAFELRVTVVGDRAFACRIDSQAQQDDTGKIDWRQGHLTKVLRLPQPHGTQFRLLRLHRHPLRRVRFPRVQPQRPVALGRARDRSAHLAGDRRIFVRSKKSK